LGDVAEGSRPLAERSCDHRSGVLMGSSEFEIEKNCRRKGELVFHMSSLNSKGSYMIY
jgi:hypothetical protein